ncbi:MAG: PQQ-binding-like beta-propeller repeat protein [Phycisphaerales bacterium]|jgi:outer membrane protein assembly factor BamB|nr:PQQ-binding-like beta-propeller repeat protein [Phycisphaerales bacterium]
MRLKLTSLAACCGVALIAALTCLGAEKPNAAVKSGWPQWHGVNRDGKSLDTNLLKSWPKGGPTLLWKVANMGQGYSTVSIGGGLIYTTGRKEASNPGNPPSEKGIVDKRPGERLFMMAIDMKGEVKWDKDITAAFNGHHVYTGSRATPTYENGKLYLISGLGVLGCYDAKTGAAKWQRDIQKEFKPLKMRWAFSESILIVGDLLIVTPGAEKCFMAALDKKTGKTVWKSGGFGPAHYSSPIYAEYKGVPMIINGGGNGIIGIHAKTGKILWANNFAKDNMANVPTPSFVDGYVFWSVGYGKGSICLKLSVVDKKVRAKVAWKSMDIRTQYGGWIIHDGHIYGNNMYEWSCVELKTGKTLWIAEGVKKGSISYADGMLYLYGIDKGQVALAPASPNGLKLTGNFNVAGRGTSRAHPVITGGRMYIRYDDNLYCFDVKAK